MKTKADLKKAISALADTYPDIFREKIEPMKGVEADITFNCKPEEVKPTQATTVSKCPHALEKEAEKAMLNLINSGVLVKLGDDEPSEWVHRGQYLPKKNGKARVISDMRGINKYVLRKPHPFITTRDIIKAMKPESKYFACFDAASGFFQVPLTHRASMMTTTMFPACGSVPAGRYRYTRSVQGLSLSSDTYNHYTDLATNPVPGLVKLVDDIFLAAETPEELLTNIEHLFFRCRQAGITLARDKAQVGDPVEYCGYLIGSDGVKVNDSKLQAIKQSKPPKNVKEVRSFLGLMNQVIPFHSRLSDMTANIRALLKKDTAFIWTPTHQRDFDELVNIASDGAMVLKPFDPELPTHIDVDASRTGLGFAFYTVNPDGTRNLIMAGSRSLTDPETRWAVCELELMAVVFGIHSVSFYLIGSNKTTTVWTDHRPLQSIGKKSLAEISNARLLRLKEKLNGFNLEFQWKKGEEHYLPDFLSRHPITPSWEHDNEIIIFPRAEDKIHPHIDVLRGHGEEESMRDIHVHLIRKMSTDPLFDEIKEEAVNCDEYKVLLKAIRSGMKAEDIEKDSVLRPYINFFDDLSIENGLVVCDNDKVVVPLKIRPKILKMLHKSHAGYERMAKMGKRFYKWPHFTQQLKSIVENCTKCQFYRPSQAQEPKQHVYDVEAPMEMLYIDIFTARGANYLCGADRYSSYPFCQRLPNMTTSTIIEVLQGWFRHFGYPRILASDAAPNLCSEEMMSFLDECGIEKITSSPYMPRSNAQIEAIVKKVKHLLLKCADEKEFLDAMLHLRNTPMKGCVYSPAEMFHGRHLRSDLPVLQSHLRKDRLSYADVAKAKPRIDSDFYGSGKHLRMLEIGDRVIIQDAVSKRWTKLGTVVGIRNTYRSYVIKLDGDAGQVVRNRCYLKKTTLPLNALLEDKKEVKKETSDVSNESTLRRSKRIADQKFIRRIRSGTKTTHSAKSKSISFGAAHVLTFSDGIPVQDIHSFDRGTFRVSRISIPEPTTTHSESQPQPQQLHQEQLRQAQAEEFEAESYGLTVSELSMLKEYFLLALCLTLGHLSTKSFGRPLPSSSPQSGSSPSPSLSPEESHKIVTDFGKAMDQLEEPGEEPTATAATTTPTATRPATTTTPGATTEATTKQIPGTTVEEAPWPGPPLLFKAPQPAPVQKPSGGIGEGIIEDVKNILSPHVPVNVPVQPFSTNEKDENVDSPMTGNNNPTVMTGFINIFGTNLEPLEMIAVCLVVFVLFFAVALGSTTLKELCKCSCIWTALSSIWKGLVSTFKRVCKVLETAIGACGWTCGHGYRTWNRGFQRTSRSSRSEENRLTRSNEPSTTVSPTEGTERPGITGEETITGVITGGPSTELTGGNTAGNATEHNGDSDSNESTQDQLQVVTSSEEETDAQMEQPRASHSLPTTTKTRASKPTSTPAPPPSPTRSPMDKPKANPWSKDRKLSWAEGADQTGRSRSQSLSSAPRRWSSGPGENEWSRLNRRELRVKERRKAQHQERLDKAWEAIRARQASQDLTNQSLSQTQPKQEQAVQPEQQVSGSHGLDGAQGNPFLPDPTPYPLYGWLQSTQDAVEELKSAEAAAAVRTLEEHELIPVEPMPILRNRLMRDKPTLFDQPEPYIPPRPSTCPHPDPGGLHKDATESLQDDLSVEALSEDETSDDDDGVDRSAGSRGEGSEGSPQPGFGGDLLQWEQTKWERRRQRRRQQRRF